MAIPHPAKFGCRRYCGSGDIIFSVVDERDSICSLKSVITTFI